MEKDLAAKKKGEFAMRFAVCFAFGAGEWLCKGVRMGVGSAVLIRALASDRASENMRIRPGVRSSENRGRSREWRGEDGERMKRRPFENEQSDHHAGKAMRGRVETAGGFREMSTALFSLGLIRKRTYYGRFSGLCDPSNRVV